MPFNNRCALLLLALAALLAACDGKKQPETLVRPVRSEIVPDLEHFTRRAANIIAHRRSEDHAHVWDKVYTRDVFGRD